MKKNKMMRLASGLLVACLLTSSIVSGTFAKYVTADDANDSARVAKWGVTVDVEASAFASEYDATSETKTNTGIAKTVVAFNGTDKLVAPGTTGTLTTASISGTPEVAVNVKKVANLTLNNWFIDSDDDGNADNEYCPLVFNVNGTDYQIDGVTIKTVAELKAAVENALNADVNFAPNTNLGLQPLAANVTWTWKFVGGACQTDEFDTKLGDRAAQDSAATIALSYEIVVTQLD